MNNLHNNAFGLYKESNGRLVGIIAARLERWPNGFKEWPITDLLHLEKNGRGKLAQNMLAVDGRNQKVITGANVADDLESERMRKVLCASSPLDLLKDHLALETFTLPNLLELWRCGNATAAYFMVPFVALDLAVRNPALTVPARQGLIETAFSAFFDMAIEYPNTGSRCRPGYHHKIVEVGARTLVKTLWTRTVLKRGCNLCVGVWWSLARWGCTEGFFLALSRIGSHSCECHFGITRSMLSGDTRWNRFLSAQVTAALIHRILAQLGLSPYIRRFQNEAGCTLNAARPGTIQASFDSVIETVARAYELLREGREEEFARDQLTVITPFVEISEKLQAIHYTEKIEKTTTYAGYSITGRWKVFGSRESRPTAQIETFADDQMEHAPAHSV
jgi:hypothetical protein